MSSPFTEAASTGNLQTIINLLQNGHKWDPAITVLAGKYGYLNILQYAVDNGLEFHTLTSVKAAVFGRMDTLEFLFKNNCIIDPRTIKYCFSETPVAPHNIECFRVCVTNGLILDEADKQFVFQILNYNTNALDMDEQFFRDLLLVEDLSNYPNLEKIVQSKHEELKQLAEACYSTLPYLECGWMPKHLIKDCLLPYL
jgi:hypothetical protein